MRAIAAIHIEDQIFLKRCGHFAGKAIIPIDEAAQKIRAAVDARSDPDFMIIARCDALAEEGMDERSSADAARMWRLAQTCCSSSRRGRWTKSSRSPEAPGTPRVQYDCQAARRRS